MPHKADESFFHSKHEWSRRKDLVLSEYLKPYLPKIASQKKPILIVDGFAGPGRFDAGDRGSPLIIAEAVKAFLDRPAAAQVNVVCVEPDDAFYARLVENTEPYPFVTTLHKRFSDVLPTIEKHADTSSTFLYLDPFTITPFEWAAMEQVFRLVNEERVSVEVLLNFNGAHFTRIARASAGMARPNDDAGGEQDDAVLTEPAAFELLNAVAGGDWWQQFVNDDRPFADAVNSITDGYCRKLREQFNEVCRHDIKERSRHQLPKYTLIFGSRHPDALLLMNDAAVRSRDVLADTERPKEETLFETRSTDLVPDPGELDERILRATRTPLARKEVVLALIRDDFGRFSQGTIRERIGHLLKSRRLISSTGKTRINDTVRICAARRT